VRVFFFFGFLELRFEAMLQVEETGRPSPQPSPASAGEGEEGEGMLRSRFVNIGERTNVTGSAGSRS
jgi:hypothetical protein